jgi:hypothetical protein
MVAPLAGDEEIATVEDVECIFGAGLDETHAASRRPTQGLP